MTRVLIIEDDAVQRRQLAELFRLEDFEVDEAPSGQAGIAAVNVALPDLVVCDIMMPGTDGFGVLEALRKHRDTALTPFIFLTAKAGGQDVRLGMGQGADDYVTKPFDPSALIASARQRLARRRLQLDEAERRAADTGMLAAVALPREMEGCLAHIETIVGVFTARCAGGDPTAEMRRALREELAQLRMLSQRLKLYGELPSLYARRFSIASDPPSGCPGELVRETARVVAEQWTRTLDLDVSTSSGSIPLPAEGLTVLVRELVDNACKFSAPSTPMVLETKQEPGCWKMVVKDHGQGMLPQQIRDIGAFKQFWNGAERPNGLGIGLVLVQALARLHSGEVLIESDPVAGTRVTVMIPSE
jgi:two-component system, sensor histidine kinase and response regulator